MLPQTEDPQPSLTPGPAEPPGPKKKKKKDKVRAAWIAFVGRIVAQIVGAIATVALGLMVLHKYGTAEASTEMSPCRGISTITLVEPQMPLPGLTP